jgi:hypothetical protein
VHGESAAQSALAGKLSERFAAAVRIPDRMETVDLLETR